MDFPFIPFAALIAVLLIAFMFASLQQVGTKTRARVLYAIAILLLCAIIPIGEHMADLPKASARTNYMIVLVFDIVVGYFCMHIAAVLKYNVLKKKSKALETALTDKEQEKVDILVAHQNEKEQAIREQELKWLTDKLKVFGEEDRKAILKSAYSFAEHDLIIPPNTAVAQNEECSQADLMYFICSAFGNMNKKRAEIINFLLEVFPAYFPAGPSALSKKLPGWEKVKERRGKEG